MRRRPSASIDAAPLGSGIDEMVLELFDVEATATNRSALESVESHGIRAVLKPIIVILRARRTG